MASSASSQPRDFLSTVEEEYLRMDRVYRPPDSFVEQLALCPRCMGGKQQLKVLEETLLKMVSLVKRKLEEPGIRNKSMFQNWLKGAAKALNNYQVIGREWICANVWQLQDPPKKKEQEYNPSKGRRDIRFFPENETELLAVAAEDTLEAMELDYQDEEQLLSTPPQSHKDHNASPRRSPRLFRKEVTSSEKETSSSGNRALSRKEGSQEPPPKKDHTLASSQGKITPRKEVSDPSRAVISSPARKRTSRKDGGYSRTVTSSPARMQKSQTEDGGQSRTVTFSPTRRQISRTEDIGHSRAVTSSPARKQNARKEDAHSRAETSSPARKQIRKDDRNVVDFKQAQRPRSVWFSDLTEASSSQEVRRQVKIVEKEHPNPSNLLKRPASGQCGQLVISTSVLKKVKTDELVGQIRQKIGMSQEKEKKKRARHSSSQECWVPGCSGEARYMKAHAFLSHIPTIFDERLEPSDERVLSGRKSALKQAGRWLLREPVELDQLAAFVVVQKMLSSTDNTLITTRQEHSMEEFCKFLREPVPAKFVMQPCNSPAVLLHWKALLLIAASLEEEERDYWKSNFQAPEDVEMQEVQPIPTARVDPDAFDSHFHLDRTLRDMGFSSHGSLEDILNNAPVEEDNKINLVGSVAIYCDPRTYPSERCLRQMPGHMSVGVGFHPKHARNSVARIDDEVRQFRRIISNPRVIAFGEIGLDHTMPMKYWAYQVDLLKKVLPYLEDRHILVIHCRGMDGDCGTEAFLLLLHILRKHVRSHQAIHLHCFTGNTYVVNRWLQVFPRTFFGFTNLARQFDEDQVAALCSLEEGRLLLETDAPYFPIPGNEVSSPSQLWFAAAAVANHRGLTPEYVLQLTLANGQHLYQQ